MFIKLFSAFAPVCLMIVSANAQTAPASVGSQKATLKKDSVIVDLAETKKTVPQTSVDTTTWKPLRRLWGYGFGDLYYDAHADKANRGPENNYNGVPSYRNAFQFRRLYLGYDYDITPKYRAEVLLASEPSAHTGTNGTTAIQNGDNLVDNKMAFWIKNFNLRVRDLWPGTDLVIGEMGTPSFALNEPAVKDLPGSATNAPTSLSEATWGYRSIEKTITDFHKNNSFDLGLALQGSFNPTKTLGYVLMVGNSSQANLLSAANDNTGFYKIIYGDIWGKFFNKHLLIDFYADYLKTAGSTATIPEQSHNMFKLFVAYTSPAFSGGVEAYTQKLTNGVTDTITKKVTNATVNGLSLWVRGSIVKGRLGYFARWDGYNPFTNYIRTDTYTMNTNYGSYNPNYKEKFITAGLDFTTAGNIHFMPNIWYLGFKDQKYANTAGYVGNDHILVFRSTVYFSFGK